MCYFWRKYIDFENYFLYSLQSLVALFYPNCELVIWDNLPDVLSTHQSALKLHAALEKG